MQDTDICKVTACFGYIETKFLISYKQHFKYENIKPSQISIYSYTTLYNMLYKQRHLLREIARVTVNIEEGTAIETLNFSRV